MKFHTARFAVVPFTRDSKDNVINFGFIIIGNILAMISSIRDSIE